MTPRQEWVGHSIVESRPDRALPSLQVDESLCIHRTDRARRRDLPDEIVGAVGYVEHTGAVDCDRGRRIETSRSAEPIHDGALTVLSCEGRNLPTRSDATDRVIG
jgi:hypothetical protein